MLVVEGSAWSDPHATARSMAAHLRGDASATVRAGELCKTAGTAHVARLIGVHVTDLHSALAHWG